MDEIWQMLDAQVASGRYPGYVAAIRIGDEVTIRAGGRMALEADSPPMDPDTLLRIASITKPMAGALTLSLIQDGVVTLDDPIARWLPETASPRVLLTPDSPLDRTTEARRPITIRHLLTMTSGWGVGVNETPLRSAMLTRGVHPGPLPIQVSADEFVTRIGELPLAFQPGEGWLYDTGTDLLGVLLARATGRSVADLLAERITGPLGMTSTSFWTPEVDRLASAYLPGPDGLELLDPPDGVHARPPAFEQLSGGLLSTAADVMRFYGAMADGGAPVLTADSVARLTTDALTDTQRQHALPFVDPGGSWGLGTEVDIEAVEPWMAPGRWGWTGGTGTTAYVDPTRDTVSVLLTQRGMAGPDDGFAYFWQAVADAAGR